MSRTEILIEYLRSTRSRAFRNCINASSSCYRLTKLSCLVCLRDCEKQIQDLKHPCNYRTAWKSLEHKFRQKIKKGGSNCACCQYLFLSSNFCNQARQRQTYYFAFVWMSSVYLRGYLYFWLTQCYKMSSLKPISRKWYGCRKNKISAWSNRLFWKKKIKWYSSREIFMSCLAYHTGEGKFRILTSADLRLYKIMESDVYPDIRFRRISWSSIKTLKLFGDQIDLLPVTSASKRNQMKYAAFACCHLLFLMPGYRKISTYYR